RRSAPRGLGSTLEVQVTMGILRKALCVPASVLCLLSLIAPAQLPAQDAVFTMESQEVVPGSLFHVDLLARLDRPTRGFQLGVQFPETAMSLAQISLQGTDLASLSPGVFERTVAQGYATVKLLFDQDPLTSPIPVGDAVKVLRFSFYMDQGL